MGCAGIVKTPFKPAPSDALCVQQITNVFAGHLYELYRTDAMSPGRIRIANYCPLNRRDAKSVGVTPCVLPEMRFKAPGVDGPNVVS